MKNSKCLYLISHEPHAIITTLLFQVELWGHLEAGTTSKKLLP
jgi:hypothetical protein